MEISATTPKPEFTSLYHLINVEMLKQCHEKIGEQLAADLSGRAVNDGESRSENVSYENGEDAESDYTELFDELEVDADESTMIYFYRSDCQECNEVEPFIKELPESIWIDGEEKALNLIKLNSREGNNGERIRALFKLYNVPSEEQMVPFIFLSDTYLAGQMKIEDELLPLLQGGHGLDFSFKNMKQED